MTNYSKHNFVYRMQKWMDSVPGQTFLNYAYSWGAAIVILGTLFKLTHLPGANFMLFLGMGTEVVVFFLSAFDRPFDKTAIGRDLAIHTREEEEEEAPLAEQADEKDNDEALPQEQVQPGVAAVIPGTVIIGGAGSTMPAAPQQPAEGEEQAAAAGAPAQGGIAIGSPAWVAQQQQLTPEMVEATTNYVEQLTQLTEMLGKVNEQSQRLTRDSEEMENLNRTLTGITKVYEMQLKSASQQIGTIDQINEQTQRMAQQIQELNSIYARMIEAMTVNMRAAVPNTNNTQE